MKKVCRIKLSELKKIIKEESLREQKEIHDDLFSSLDALISRAKEFETMKNRLGQGYKTIVSNGYDKLYNRSKSEDIDYVNYIVHLLGTLIDLQQ